MKGRKGEKSKVRKGRSQQGGDVKDLREGRDKV